VKALSHARLAVPAALLLGGGLVLTACGAVNEAGAAAVVDGRVISDSALQTVTDQLNTSPRVQTKLTPRDVLVTEIIGPWVLDAASAAGRGVSESQARALAPEITNPSPDTVEFLRVNAAAQQLDQSFGPDLLAKIAKAEITVNPRYGTFDAKSFTITPRIENWLKPVEPATPTPTTTPRQ